MPTFRITDPNTGQKLRITGDSPPTEVELEEIFASQAPQPQAPQGSSFPGASFIEPAATLISGAGAEVAAGLAGIGQVLNPFAEPGAGARAVEGTREALTFQPKTPAGQAGLQTVGGIVEPVARALQGAEKFLGDETFEATGSPALSAAAATLPTAIAEALGLVSIKGFIKGTKKTKQLAKSREIKKAIVEAAPEIEQLKETSRAVYKELDDSGVRLLPKAFDGLENRIKGAVTKAGFDPGLSPKTNAVLKRFASEKGQVKSLTEIDNLRKVAQNAASAIEPADARLGGIIVDNIDQFLDKVSPTAFAKGKVKAADVTPKFKVARELWGRARRSELIGGAFKEAGDVASGLENGLRIEFRKILKNKKQNRFFKPKELEVMREVVRGTTKANIAKAIGRFGIDEKQTLNALGGIGLGGAVGGVSGGIAVPLIGTVSKRLAERLTKGKAEFADVVVRAGTDAEKITEAYLSRVSKKLRSAEELSELLVRPDIALDKLLTSKNSFIKEAAEIGRGTQILNAVATGTPGAIASTEETR